LYLFFYFVEDEVEQLIVSLEHARDCSFEEVWYFFFKWRGTGMHLHARR